MEQVALTNPVTNDRTLPAVTFCTWLGTLVYALLSFLNQFFFFRQEPLSITSISAQIAVAPLRHLMAATLTWSASSRMTLGLTVAHPHRSSSRRCGWCSVEVDPC
ncbi:hypothetical protein RHGRI_035459 [Rhododendron griersonianum]|uniref:Uncharacterized protein n=1 Tax=Rhododendron griersonianum TaxID=479676 RepID=A0AAV6HM66_9ERIC|nr:hypothetical protein RHGRI_035459 [Rhododendron griersonianum]